MPSKTTLLIRCGAEEHPIGGNSWQKASAYELVEAARGKFLPKGAVPYRLLRAGEPVAFFDPHCPLIWSGPKTGDALEVAASIEQEPKGPSFLRVLRAVEKARQEAIGEANAEAFELGWPPIDTSHLI